MGIETVRDNKNNDNISYTYKFKPIVAGAAVSGFGWLNFKSIKSVHSMPEQIHNYDIQNNGKLSQSIMEMFDKSSQCPKGVKILDYSKGITDEILEDSFNVTEKMKQKYSFNTYDEFIEWYESCSKKERTLELGKAESTFAMKLYKCNGEASDILIDEYKKKYPKYSVFANTIQKNIYKGHNMIDYVQKGKNAYILNGSKVHINMKNNSAGLPHELGHIKNRNEKGLGKVLTKLRYSKVPSFAFWTALCVAAFRDKKAEGQTSDTVVGKGMDFVKDNCVGIAALSETPLVLEEGWASVQGLKMAKNYLKPNDMSMLKKYYAKALMSYATYAGMVISAVYLVDSLRNCLFPPKTENC